MSPRIIWIFLTEPKLVGPPLAERAFKAVFNADVVNEPTFSTSPKIFTFNVLDVLSVNAN